MKKVLALHFSQTGQLERIVRSAMAPLISDPDVEVTFQEIRPLQPYPFPWPLVKFFDQFPECVTYDPPAVELPGFDPNVKYDLVVLGYQTWYLSPSLPATGFLKSQYAKVLKDTPVVSIIGCRNMWYRGQHALRRMIEAAGGRFAGNIVREDQGGRAETFITVTVWLLTGKREVWKGVLSPAGVSDADINSTSSFGRELLSGLKDGRLARGVAVLDGSKSAPVDRKYMLAEEIGWRGFRAGASLVKLAGKQGNLMRIPFLALFVLLLGLGIVFMVPLSILAILILSRTAGFKRWQENEVRYLEGNDIPKA